MAQKTISVKIDVNDQSLKELEGNLEGVNNQIGQIENSAGKLDFEQKFQAAEGAVKVFAGALEAAVGTIGLLGIESKVFENYERYALSTLSFARGVIDMADGMNKLRISGALTNAMLTIQNALNIATAATMKLLGIATSTTSLAFKGLRAAIASTGIGLLVVGLGLLVEKLLLTASAADKLKDAQDRLTKKTKEFNDVIDKGTQYKLNDINEEIAALELLGNKQQEISALEAEAYENSVKALEAKIKEQESIRATEDDINSEFYKDSLEAERDFRLQLDTLVSTRAVELLNKQRDLNKELADLQKEQAAERMDILKQMLDAQVITTEDARATEILKINMQYKELILRAKRFGINTEQLELARTSNIAKLKNAYRAEDLANERAYTEELNNSVNNTSAFAIAMYSSQTESIQENTQVKMNLLQMNYNLEAQLLDEAKESELSILQERLLKEEITQDEHDALMLQKKKEYEDARLALDISTNTQAATINKNADDIILQSKLALWSQLAVGFGNLSLLFERGTAAAKAAALATVAINTAIGFVQGLDIAQKSAAATGPAAAFAFPIFYATQVAAVLAAAAQAKNILKTQKAPSSTSSAAPASRGTVTQTKFSGPDAPITPVVQPAIRTYVLTGDVTSAQEAEAKLNARRNVG